MLLGGTLVPIFVLFAFKGGAVWIGIAQAVALVSAEVLQWKLSKRAVIALRFGFALGAYLLVNLGFTIGFLLYMHFSNRN